MGGAGDDTLLAGSRRAILIGGDGADVLRGLDGDALLVAGTTRFDANETALAALLDEWTSGRDYRTRVANLTGTGTGPQSNGGFFLAAAGPDATVFDDGDANVLSGGAGVDLYFAHLRRGRG